MPGPVLATFALRGAGGEPVDLARTLASHGVAALPPNRVDTDSWTFETTLTVASGAVHSVRLAPTAGLGRVRLESAGVPPPRAAVPEVTRLVRHMLRLDEDLSAFYALAAADPQLAWATRGAGRMLRGATVFEDVVKTICTTNCAWSATERMVSALVQHLGRPDPSGARAFPTATALAEAGDGFYREVGRFGYRGAYVAGLARAVADGTLDLEQLHHPSVPDAEVERCLLRLPGVGPYAAAHVMLMTLGRYGPLVLDSWTRPAYARLLGRRAADATIRRHFRRYGRFAGLAFWLRITRDWVAEPA